MNELDFPAVTICKDGLNFQSVRETLEVASGQWEGSRRKRSGSKEDYCQLNFNRTCDQVDLTLQSMTIVHDYTDSVHYLYFNQVATIVEALASPNIEESTSSSALSLHALTTFACYHWSAEDHAAIIEMGNGTDAERLVCEGYGHFYTKGLNSIELRWSDFGTFTSHQVAKETIFLLLAA